MTESKCVTNEQEHKERHIELQRALDELLADYIFHTDCLPSKTTIPDLLQWSYQQTVLPTPKVEG